MTEESVYKGRPEVSEYCQTPVFPRLCVQVRFITKAHAVVSGGARRRRRRRPPTASRLKGPRKQKSFAYKLLKRGLAKRFAYKLLKRGLANLMSPTSTSGVAPPLAVVTSRILKRVL
ncbi:hypothetical protein EVAR_47401_1 [Eumeta japonica]|uniref:Uncharacterized protein n=1 Tax=Eumeta variegata TaxID=151549 RepID=A0A4C1XZQ9_EUMVA|nr:hypothetical protein EVAR_47401_1 [Eumeta japonica]